MVGITVMPMLLRHSAFYALARGVPGIINFLAIVIFTRMLIPESYGQYALVLAAVGFFDSVLFQWLRSGLLRFLPANRHNPQVLLSTCFFGFFVIVLLTAVIGLLFYVFTPEEDARAFIALALLLLWTGAWYELNLELLRTQLYPLRYGLMSILKSVLGLMVGALLVLQGLGAHGPLIGVIAGTLVAAVVMAWNEWTNIGIKLLDRILLRELLQYGLPLTATFALSFLVASSDRFMLAWILGPEAAGLYAPGYDLAQYSIGTLMAIVNLAAYPLAIHALEQHGEDAARLQLQKNALLLLGIALPAALGLAMCAENIADVVFGEKFRDTAKLLIPMISLSALLAGGKMYYLDLSFQLGKRTRGQIVVMLAAAITNILLNLWWIPVFGVIGAAYATVVAYAIAFVMSGLLGRRIFRLPPLSVDIFKVVSAVVFMGLALWFTLDMHGWLALLAQVTLAGGVYLAALLVLNVAKSRLRLRYVLARYYP